MVLLRRMMVEKLVSVLSQRVAIRRSGSHATGIATRIIGRGLKEPAAAEGPSRHSPATHRLTRILLLFRIIRPESQRRGQLLPAPCVTRGGSQDGSGQRFGVMGPRAMGDELRAGGSGRSRGARSGGL